ncbi:MAG: hypothetical protein RL304_621 [Verrucomicrobiota bacterium]
MGMDSSERYSSSPARRTTVLPAPGPLPPGKSSQPGPEVKVSAAASDTAHNARARKERRRFMG